MVKANEKSRFRTLVNLLEDTKSFEAKSHGWERDRKYEDEGGQVFYAVDTNIFNFFLKPFEMGPNRLRDDGSGRTARTGYSQILRSDPPEVAGVVGDALSDAIFFMSEPRPIGKRKARDLLLLDGTNREVLRVLQAALRDAENARRRAQNEAYTNIGMEVIGELASLDTVSKYNLVKKRLPQLFNFFFGEAGTRRTIEKFAQLGSGVSATYVGATARGDVDKFPMKFLELIEETRSNESFTQRRIALRDAIQIEFPSSVEKDQQKLDNDLDALSQLLALNEMLVPHHFKICLVSGAWSLFDALNGISITENGAVQIGNRPADNGDFKVYRASHFCLRQPLAFWGSRAFRRNLKREVSHNDESDFIDQWTSWVDPIVPKSVAISEEVSTYDLREHARRAMQVGLDGGVIEQFQESWDGFCSILIPSRAEALAQFDSEFETVFSDLDDAFEESVDTLFDSCAWIGLAVSRTAQTNMPSRLTPSIIFDCSDEAQHAVDALESSLYPKDNGFEAGVFVNAMNRLEKSDSIGYFFNIGVSMMFAIERQYDAARLYATRAVNIALSLSRSNAVEKQISGREAFFLLSSIVRLKAKSTSDFDSAANLMRLARSRLALDRSTNDIGVSAIRFDCEDVARDLAQYLFSRFRLRVKRTEFDTARFLRRIRSLYDREYLWREEALREKLEIRLSINALTAAIYQDSAAKGDEGNREILEQARFHLDCALRKSEALGVEAGQGTFLHRTTILAAKCLFLDSASKHVTRSQIEELFSDENIKLHWVTSYDLARYKEMKQRCLFAI